MTDRIKERLYKISQNKHLVDIYIGFKGILLLYLVASLVFYQNFNVSAFISIFLIGDVVYYFIKSFKKYDSSTIKKNKLSLILLSSTESVSSILLIIICIIIYNLPLDMGYIWESIIVILLLIVLLIVSNKISQYFKKKIVH